MNAKVTANRSKATKMREEMAKLPKGDPRRKAISAAIDGLNSENISIKSAASGIRTADKAVSDTAKKNIETKKAKSGVYHEHDHQEEGDELPSIFSDEFYMEAARSFNNGMITKLIRTAKDHESREIIRNMGFKYNSFEGESVRPMTFAEKKVNFDHLTKAMDDYTTKIENTVQELTERQKADMLKQVAAAVESNDIKAV